MNRSSARRPRSGLHCREAMARSSRSPIGDCYDCAMCESFVRDLKRPGFARCGHLRGRVSQGPMEGRKRKTRVALPSRNVGNDQPSTESGQLHLSSRRQRCDDPLNPPSTFRSVTPTDWPMPGSSPLWEAWATHTTTPWPRRSSASTRPRSFAGEGRGETSKRSSTPRWNGSTGSIIDDCSNRSGNIPPVEFEQLYYQCQEGPVMEAGLN